MELIPGKEYLVKHTGQFCHAYNISGNYEMEKYRIYSLVYVGTVHNGSRHIFYWEKYPKNTYFMFGSTIDYIVDSEFEGRIKRIEEELEDLKKNYGRS